MALLNTSFEVEGVAPGCPSGWTIATRSERQYAAFTDGAWDGFESGWDNDTYAFVFTGSPAAFLTLALTPKLVENFEEFWDTNQNYVFAFSGAAALFDTSPEAFEDFEENWDSNESYAFSLTGTLGSFDSGSPEDFEDFEEEWDSNESYVYTFSGTAADFDTAPEAFEDFEEDWLPDWQMTTIP